VGFKMRGGRPRSRARQPVFTMAGVGTTAGRGIRVETKTPARDCTSVSRTLQAAGSEAADDRRPRGGHTRGLLQHLAARSRPLAFVSGRPGRPSGDRIDLPARGCMSTQGTEEPRWHSSGFQSDAP
jgi:hypothetical protein